MGQKINPLGFRLDTNYDPHSLWFAQPKNYSKELQEDKKIRDSIKYVQKNRIIFFSGVERITHIKIQKRIDLIQINIYIILSKFLVIESSRLRGIDHLEINVKKKLIFMNQKLNIAITRISKPYRYPNILAEFIAEQLKNRVYFRKAMKKAIEFTEQTNMKGIQIQISGRIDGKEIARIEWIRQGKVPLQTIRAKINYCSYPIRTIYGLLGIKIWIFIEEE